MNLRFEEVEESHLEALLEIYNDYVKNSTATFQIIELKLAAFQEQLIFKEPYFKSYTIVDQGKEDVICGYASLFQHKKREAFDITAEIALYLSDGYTGKGIGSLALDFLEEKARKTKFHSLIASISSENERSITLFEKKGYVKCGYYKEVGKKFGRLLGLVTLQKQLR